jgi:hypothetical protein
MSETSNFAILSPAFHANPFPTLDRMHAAGPVVRVKLPIVGRTWLTVTHDACTTLLKDHQTFARDPANAGSRTQARILKVLPRTISLLASNMTPARGSPRLGTALTLFWEASAAWLSSGLVVTGLAWVHDKDAADEKVL